MEIKKARKQRRGKIDNDRSNPQHTEEAKRDPRIALLEEYWNFDSFKLIPITKSTIMRLGQEAVKWANTAEKAYSVRKFLKEQGIDGKTWRRWCKTHPELQSANDQMVMIIGCRREEGLIERKFEPQSTMYMMPHYADDWKDMVEWRAGLSAKANNENVKEIYKITEICMPVIGTPKDKDE